MYTHTHTQLKDQHAAAEFQSLKRIGKCLSIHSTQPRAAVLSAPNACVVEIEQLTSVHSLSQPDSHLMCMSNVLYAEQVLTICLWFTTADLETKLSELNKQLKEVQTGTAAVSSR